MTSEAAPYFPDALVSTTTVHEQTRRASESPSEFLDLTQSPSHTLRGSARDTSRNSEISNELLLRQVSGGEKDALALLFRRYARAVRNIALRILKDDSEAEDLVQEVFLFLHRKAGLYNPGQGRAVTWILHVAYHRAFDRRRRLNARHFYSTLELDEAGRHLADSAGPIAGEQSLREALGKGWMEQVNVLLTPEQRETIELFLEGYALKEIAERTGRSLVNVRSYYYRGLERLRKHFLGEKTRSR